MLRFKPEVRIGMPNPQMHDVLVAAAVWSLTEGVDVHISSMQDPAPGRKADSLHQFGLAVDLNTDTNTAEDRASLGNYLRVALGAGYDLVLEADHVHIEWDMHRPPLKEVQG